MLSRQNYLLLSVILGVIGFGLLVSSCLPSATRPSTPESSQVPDGTSIITSTQESTQITEDVPTTPPTEPATPEITQVPEDIPTTPQTVPPTPEIAPIPAATLSPYFIEGELILVGERVAIDNVVAENLAVFELEFIVEKDLSYLAQVRQAPGEFIPLEQDLENDTPFYDLESGNYMGPEELVMRLYAIHSGDSVIDIIETFNQQQDESEPPIVYADPNYRTGLMTAGPCGSPFGVEGSPFSVEGSPFGVEGSPGGGAATPASSGEFVSQWGLTTIGVNSSTTITEIQPVVGVFDTSPFSITRRDQTMTTVIKATPSDLHLTVFHPFELPTIPTLHERTFSVKEHGLFVTGLVHGVAQNSQIQLIRVLDENGCGDIFRLAYAIHEFNEQFDDPDELMKGVVINLSLGIAKPTQAHPNRPDWADRALVSFTTALMASNQRGAIIVAAAGNDSTIDQNGTRAPAQLPAAYQRVIGVAASNKENGLTCYTNWGDVMAPGGEAKFRDGKCEIKTQDCLNEGGSCPWGLISLYEPSGSQYAYWVGTSFATPLVSGIAAQALGSGKQQAEVINLILNNPGVICLDLLNNQSCPVP